jgi:hypothetical protein
MLEMPAGAIVLHLVIINISLRRKKFREVQKMATAARRTQPGSQSIEREHSTPPESTFMLDYKLRPFPLLQHEAVLLMKLPRLIEFPLLKDFHVIFPVYLTPLSRLNLQKFDSTSVELSIPG